MRVQTQSTSWLQPVRNILLSRLKALHDCKYLLSDYLMLVLLTLNDFQLVLLLMLNNCMFACNLLKALQQYCMREGNISRAKTQLRIRMMQTLLYVCTCIQHDIDTCVYQYCGNGN